MVKVFHSIKQQLVNNQEQEHSNILNINTQANTQTNTSIIFKEHMLKYMKQYRHSFVEKTKEAQNVDKILKIVDETFDEEIYTWVAETPLGLESGIEGREEFIKKLKEKLQLQIEWQVLT